MKYLLFLFSFLTFNVSTLAQTEETEIRKTLLNYINGTSYNQPELINNAFYEDANLYLTNRENELWIVPAQEYASWYENKKHGEFNGRIGNVISIDQLSDIATAKVEIIFPESDIRYLDLFLLKKIEDQWKIISKTAAKDDGAKSVEAEKILFIVSNASSYGNSDIPTGNSFSELVNAYHTFRKAGLVVDFVSPEGGAVPLSYINTSDALCKEYLYNPDFIYALKTTKSPKEIDPSNYKAVHYIGGGAAMFGVPENEEIQNIAMTLYEEHNGIVSSVCHGTAGIVNLKKKDGTYLYQDMIVSGYPDSFEKKEAEYFKQFPFLIQETIESRGGTFKFSPRNVSHVEVHGNLVTGQNYLSSEGVAQKIIEMIQNQKEAN